MIHHQGNNGRKLAISFFFNTSESDVISSQKFFNDLIGAKDGSSAIDPKDILGGYNKIKDFFYDKGAAGQATSSICHMYEWAIYPKVIEMSLFHFNEIKENLVEVDLEQRRPIKVGYNEYSGSQDEYSSIFN